MRSIGDNLSSQSQYTFADPELRRREDMHVMQFEKIAASTKSCRNSTWKEYGLRRQGGHGPASPDVT